MWTNVFRIGELHVISWFQFLPFESDPNMLSEKSLKAEQKDAATYMIISAHLQLQNEGFLSAWTNSFVGPWDPSQGMHNPDEKIKLWLFLPGRHSSIVENAQAAVSRLRVVGSGLWLAPGDSEEVAVALSQALRNSIERALRGLSYVRFGDVFTRSNPFTQHGKIFRRPQPTLEFIFAATEEAIYVHAIVSAKHIRGVCSDDMERMLVHCYSRSNGEGLPGVLRTCQLLCCTIFFVLDGLGDTCFPADSFWLTTRFHSTFFSLRIADIITHDWIGSCGIAIVEFLVETFFPHYLDDQPVGNATFVRSPGASILIIFMCCPCETKPHASVIKKLERQLLLVGPFV